eukprot:789487-Pleurochrysis_carterae.AAC.1
MLRPATANEAENAYKRQRSVASSSCEASSSSFAGPSSLPNLESAQEHAIEAEQSRLHVAKSCLSCGKGFASDHGVALHVARTPSC